MKKLLLIVALISQSCFAQESAKDVSEEQIATYKIGLETGCRNQGRIKGDDKADSHCACVVKVLNENMSQEEWQQVYFFGRKRQEREEIRVLGPHMKKVGICRAN